MNIDALKDLLFRMADDALIIAHRHSEWTGLGPLLEEDIAFSSIAQDKLGHALSLYQLLQDLGEGDPDSMAFGRHARDFRCCMFVELPNGEYDFSIVRQYLFDTAEYLRYEMLTRSSFTPLATLAKKIQGEIRYHLYHGRTMIARLGGYEGSVARMQAATDLAMPWAYSIFEEGASEKSLIEERVFEGEEKLKRAWQESVEETLKSAGLTPASATDTTIHNGGRSGKHTEFLTPLLLEMTEVYRIDPAAQW